MLSLPMRPRTWTGLAGGEKALSIFAQALNVSVLPSFMHDWVIQSKRLFAHCLCFSKLTTQYQNDLCPAQLRKRLPISLCILSGEESVAGNLIILRGAVDVLVESHVMNWFWSCRINLSKMPKAWFHLISDGVKTIDVSSWEMVVIVAWRVSVFIMWPGFFELKCGQLGIVRWGSLGFMKCLFFFVFTALV